MLFLLLRMFQLLLLLIDSPLLLLLDTAMHEWIAEQCNIAISIVLVLAFVVVLSILYVQLYLLSVM